MILLMESEQEGISNVMEKNRVCNINIPIMGSIDSVNSSNAASTILFKTYTRRINND